MARAFGRKMGSVVDSDLCFAIDYYGLVKKSRGFLNMVSELSSDIPVSQIKSIAGTTVYFAAIRMESIAVYAPDLVSDFPWFKKAVLDARGFNHGYGK